MTSTTQTSSVLRDRVNMTCAIITALGVVFGSIAIPIVLDKVARDGRTIRIMNETDQRISDILDDKRALDADNNKTGSERFSFAYLSKNPKAEADVFKLLNIYDFICLGGNQDLLSNKLISIMRQDALKKTWADYHEYIDEHRHLGPETSGAWGQCDIWLKNNS
jgi:hypothetical protein